MMNDSLKNKLYKSIITALIAGIIATILVMLKSKQTEKISPLILDDFAKCLAAKNIVMYGADWCSHCQDQKKIFGDSFKLIPYVECPKESKLCLEKGVEGYPAWIFPDGQKIKGVQDIKNLSLLSGCSLGKTVK